MAANGSVELYPGQRNKEKRLLFSRFVFRAIEDAYKAKFFDLFGTQCFKCGQPETYIPGSAGMKILCIDHHVPMAHGGTLVPGNLVSLCRTCNNRKRDQMPDVFYTSEELKTLAPLLERQHALFDFTFDEDAWQRDPAGYLVRLGLSPLLVQALLHDEEHPNFIGLPSPPRVSFTLSINWPEGFG